MDAELRKEINEAVEKSLPKQVGTALQERLRDLEMKERQLETANTNLETTRKELNGKKAEVDRLTALVKSEEILEKKAREIEKRETAQKVFELEVKLAASEASNEKVMGFVAALMRNTEFRKSTFLSNDHYFKGDGGRDSAPTGGSEDSEAH